MREIYEDFGEGGAETIASGNIFIIKEPFICKDMRGNECLVERGERVKLLKKEGEKVGFKAGGEEFTCSREQMGKVFLSPVEYQKHIQEVKTSTDRIISMV